MTGKAPTVPRIEGQTPIERLEQMIGKLEDLHTIHGAKWRLGMLRYYRRQLLELHRALPHPTAAQRRARMVLIASIQSDLVV